MNETKSSIRILKSSSYICVFDPTAEQNAFLNDFAKKINVRKFEVVGLDEFIELVFQVKHNIGCFINTQNLSDADKKKMGKALEGISCPVVFTSDLGVKRENYHYTSSVIEAEAFLKTTLEVLMPKRLNELTVFSANNVLKYLISDEKNNMSFKQVKNLEGFSCDLILSCQVQSENMFGYCFLKVNTQFIDQVLDPEYVESEFMMLDFTKEMVNQFWGIVCQNIRKVGINPKIGLPSACDINGNAGIAKTYIPSVIVKDEKNIFSFEIGFTALDHTVPFDLTGIDFNVEAPEEGELELL